MKSISGLCSARIPHSSFWMESITFPHSSGCRWEESLTSPDTRGSIRGFDISRTSTGTAANRCLRAAGSDCTDRRAPSVEAGIQLKAIKPFSSIIFILTTALSFTQDILPPFFSVRNCVFAPEREPTRKAVGRSDPRVTPRLIEK